MIPVSTYQVPCPFPKGDTLMDLPGRVNEVLSPVLCKGTGCPDVKFPRQVLPLASTPRVSREKLRNASTPWEIGNLRRAQLTHTMQWHYGFT